MKAQFRYNKTIKTFVWLPSKTFASKYAAPVEGGNREREGEGENVCVEIPRTTFVKRRAKHYSIRCPSD